MKVNTKRLLLLCFFLNKFSNLGNPFLMLLPGIAIPVDNDIIDSDDETQHK